MEKNTKRNIQINGTSPKDDVLAAIDGTWSSTLINGWKVIHLSGRLETWQFMCNEPGSYLLPRKLDEVAIAKIYNSDGSTSCQIIKIQQEAIQFSKPCFVEVTITNV